MDSQLCCFRLNRLEKRINGKNTLLQLHAVAIQNTNVLSWGLGSSKIVMEANQVPWNELKGYNYNLTIVILGTIQPNPNRIVLLLTIKFKKSNGLFFRCCLKLNPVSWELSSRNSKVIYCCNPERGMDHPRKRMNWIQQLFQEWNLLKIIRTFLTSI